MQKWCTSTQRRDLARPNCDLYVFGSSRKHFISTHSLPTVFIRANPRDPRPISRDPITLSRYLLASSYPDRGLHLPPTKSFVGSIALRTIKIGGHIAKCPDADLDTDIGRGRVAHHHRNPGQTRAICVNIRDLFRAAGAG